MFFSPAQQHSCGRGKTSTTKGTKAHEGSRYPILVFFRVTEPALSEAEGCPSWLIKFGTDPRRANLLIQVDAVLRRDSEPWAGKNINR
jgi:hypothetical protein